MREERGFAVVLELQPFSVEKPVVDGEREDEYVCVCAAEGRKTEHMHICSRYTYVRSYELNLASGKLGVRCITKQTSIYARLQAVNAQFSYTHRIAHTQAVHYLSYTLRTKCVHVL